MHYLIGLDDTDNQMSRGTGYKARLLAEALVKEDLCHLKSITKHQLFKDPRIAYTSDNQSACIEAEISNVNAVTSFCRHFLKTQHESGSNPAFCIAQWDEIDQELKHFGQSAKNNLIDTTAAIHLASAKNIHSETSSDHKCGLIGAMAACALRATNNDGYFIWLQGLPRFKSGIYSAIEIHIAIDIDLICQEDGTPIPDRNSVFVSDKLTPLLRNGQKTIYVEAVNHYQLYQWETLRASYLKIIA